MITLQDLFLKESSFDNYNDAAILETLLVSAGVRCHVEPVVARLFDNFGTLKGILEARPVQLMNVEGVTKKMATMISMVVPLAKAYERTNMQDVQRIKNRCDAETYCRSCLMGERNEKFLVIGLNAQLKVNGQRVICEGSLAEVNAYPRKVMETALNLNAHSVIISHNHPGGTPTPSPEDISSTLQLQKVLNGVGIQLLDHIIIAGKEAYSLVQHGDISYRNR